MVQAEEPAVASVTTKLTAAGVAVAVTIVLAVGGLVGQAFRLGGEIAETRAEVAALREHVTEHDGEIAALENELHDVEHELLEFGFDVDPEH